MLLTASAVEISDEARVSKGAPALTPAQQKTAGDLLTSLSAGHLCLLRASAGMGKTSVLRWIQAQNGAAFVNASHFMTLLTRRDPAAIEETFMETLQTAADNSDLILVDDLHLIMAVVESFEYHRSNLINAALSAVLANAETRGKKFVFAVDKNNEPSTLRERASVWKIEDFEPEDFAHLCAAHLGLAAKALDFEKIHRFAPALNGYQLKNACLWLIRQPSAVTTDSFIEYLQGCNLASNVDLEEVEPVAWADLKGMPDVVEELEAKIALPFENGALALALNLKPKRGVLLAGPPGTGKTTIGRALAHRLKGKFFLIDGTMNAEEGNFHERVEQIFAAAKRNAPAVIFIDDADVIFEAGHRGLYRYLLTMLDGLESASNGQVCVVITAMDVSALPPALLRSGRVELWLTTRLPDDEAREVILREKLSCLAPPVCSADVKLLARKSNGLSGADLKSVVEEGKLLYAHALSKGLDVAPVETFFLKAIEASLTNRRNYGRRKASAYAGPRFGFPQA